MSFSTKQGAGRTPGAQLPRWRDVPEDQRTPGPGSCDWAAGQGKGGKRAFRQLWGGETHGRNETRGSEVSSGVRGNHLS